MILELIAFLMVLNSAVNIELINLKHVLSVTLHALYFDLVKGITFHLEEQKLELSYLIYICSKLYTDKRIFFILIFDKYFTVSN